VLKGDAEVDTASLGPPVHSLDVNDPAQMKAELAKVSYLSTDSCLHIYLVTNISYRLKVMPRKKIYSLTFLV
jgi:hypothetical protein